MNGTYHPGLVALSVLIAAFASCVALGLANRVSASRGRSMLAWLAGGALAMGVGIWSMHLVGMLALRIPGVMIAHDVPLMFLAMGIAVAASVPALYVVSRPPPTRLTQAGAALTMGAAIAGMHYTGMRGMRTGTRVEWNLPLVALSIAVAVAVSFAALGLVIRIRAEPPPRARRRRLGASALMGVAIAGMHYTGMAAARFVPGGGAQAAHANEVLATRGLAVAVAAGTALILAIAVVASIVGRELGRRAALTGEVARLYAEARERGETYRLLFDDNPHPMWVYDPETFRLIAANDTASRQFGYSRAEFLAMTLYDLQLPEDHPALRRHLEHATAETVSTWRMRRKDGTLVDVEVDARPTAYEGKPARIALIHDVTERTRAAEMLRRSEEHLRAVIERASDIISILEPDGTIRYESPSVERVVGYRPDELVGRNVFAYIHSEDQEGVRDALAKLLEQAASMVVRLRFRHKGGGWRVLEAIGSNLLDNPAVGGIVVNTRDVTDRARAEEQERELIREHAARAAAEEAQRRVEEILESITDAFFAFDAEWRVTYVNRQAEVLLDRPREALLREDFWTLYGSLSDTPVRARFQQALVEGHSTEAEVASSRTPGAWYYLHFSPTRPGAVVYARDVSWRKQAEDRDRFQAHLLNAIGQAVIATDASGTITYWNRAAEQLYGWTEAEALGRNVMETVPSEAMKAQAGEIFGQLAAGAVWSGEFMVRRRDGTEFPAWVSDTPVLDAAGALQAIIGISFDITRRRESEHALEEERRRLAEAQRVAHLGSWEWDLATNDIRWSDQHFRLWGYEPGAFTPTRDAIKARTHPDDQDKVRAATQAALRAGGRFEHEYRVVRPDGEIRVMDSRGEVICSESGQPVRVVGTSQDITERRRQEEALFRTRAALDASMDGICIVSSAGRFDYVNQAKARMFGYDSAEQLVGEDWRVAYPPEEIERLGEEIMPLFALSGQWRGEVVGLKRDGATFPAAMSITRLEGGGWVAVDWDITASRLAEDELRRRSEMVRLLQMAAATANESATLEEALERVVGQVCEFTHLDVGHAFVADAATGELVPTDRWCVALPERSAPFTEATRHARFGRGQGLPGRALATGGPVWIADVLEDSHFRRGEAARAANLHAAIAIPVHAGSDVVAVLEFFSGARLEPDRLLLDTLGNVGTQLGRVAERTRAELELRAARQEAERANRAKSEFLSRISHELRTPLNAILGFGQILEMEAERDDDRESAEQILRAGRHLLGLIDEVLDLSRIEAGGTTVSVESVEVRNTVAESLDLLRHLARQHEITIEPGDALSTGAVVRADPQRLKQVLLNLLSNAIKYNRRGGRVTLSCERVGAAVRIGVADTGMGIPPDKLHRLFVPFDRLDAERSEVEGTGLGLALSRGLVQAMGGTLGVGSREGEGSLFWAELPLADAPAQLAGGPAGAAQPEAEEPPLVLVIEDNLANLRLVERVFERRPGLRLISAMQGSIGLDLARQCTPDLILLDLDLPDLPGDQVLAQLRRDPALREVPVVMISGNAIPAQVRRLRDLGARAYLTKPFDIQELLRLVDELVPEGGGGGA